MSQRPRDESLSDAVSSGDPRRALIAIRDYLAHELEGNRCQSCNMSKLRTGDTAALVLRLQKVLEDIEAIPETSGEVSDLELIRRRRSARASATPDPAAPIVGNRSGPRKQGGRHPSGTRPAGTGNR